MFQIHEGVCGLCSSNDQSQVASVTKKKVYSVTQPCITTAYVYIRVYIPQISPSRPTCWRGLQSQSAFLNLRGNDLKIFLESF